MCACVCLPPVVVPLCALMCLWPWLRCCCLGVCLVVCLSVLACVLSVSRCRVVPTNVTGATNQQRGSQATFCSSICIRSLLLHHARKMAGMDWAAEATDSAITVETHAAYVRACVRACVCVCVCGWVRACVRACVLAFV